MEQRKVKINVEITWRDRNSDENKLILDVQILSDSSLKDIYDDIYRRIEFGLNKKPKIEVREEVRKEPKNDNYDDVPF